MIIAGTVGRECKCCLIKFALRSKIERDAGAYQENQSRDRAGKLAFSGGRKMSKFDYAMFYGDYSILAINKEKYIKDKAIEIAKAEFSDRKPCVIALEDAYVRHRAGVNDDGEPCVGWWLEWNKNKRSCPVYAFHVTYESEYPYLKNGYELIELK